MEHPAGRPVRTGRATCVSPGRPATLAVQSTAWSILAWIPATHTPIPSPIPTPICITPVTVTATAATLKGRQPLRNEDHRVLDRWLL